MGGCFAVTPAPWEIPPAGVGAPGLPAEVPSYWMIYFDVDSVDESFRRAVAAGASEMVAPSDFAGGRFAILTDPQGAMFGLLKTS
jgi:predicted enzyme related to lactoylglutathione lyase